MSTSPATRTALELLLEAPLEAYSAELAAHGHTYGDGARSCRCGFVGKAGRNAGRSVGLHIAAAERRASKAYDAAAKLELDRLAAMTPAERRELEAAQTATARAGRTERVLARIVERRIPEAALTAGELELVEELEAAGRVQRFRDGAEWWLEATDAERGLEPMTADELELERPLVVLTAAAPVVLEAGTRILLAPTDDPAVAHVLTVDTDGRQEAAGTALTDAVERATRAPRAPKRVDAATFTTRPVRELGPRLRRIARNAERGAGYRRELDQLVDDLRRSGRPAHAELADRLVEAAGKPGNRSTGGRSLARLITALDNTAR